MKTRKKYIWPTLLIVLLTVSAIVFEDHKISTDTKVMPPTYSQQLATDNSNSTDNQLPITDNSGANTKNLSLPILMYHHIRDFNDPTDKIGTNLSVSPSDFATQLDLIKERGYTAINFQDILNGNLPEKSIILTFDDGYENFYQNAYPELKKRGMKAVSYIIVNDIGKNEYMTRDQIIEINNNDIEIGSHTLSHPDLATATSTRAEKEILDSKKQLEDIIVKKVISFCYPSGKYNDATENYVKNSGYSFAVTTKGGITTFADLFTLNRYRINNGTTINSWIK